MNAQRSPWILVLLLGLAFGLRVHRLDAHPLWWDEGLTIHFGMLPPAENLELAIQTDNVNPPFFHWMVGLWTGAAGSSPLAVRMVNVWGGVVLVALTFALGHRLTEPLVGTLGATLVALSPFQVHYAQEAKGYIFVGVMALLGLLLWFRLHAHGMQGSTNARPVHWLGYGVTMGLALGANYLAVLLIVTENLATVGCTVRAWRRGAARRAVVAHWARWLGAQALGAALILPFVVATFESTSRGLVQASVAQTPQHTPGGYLVEVLGTLAEGVGQPAGLPTAALTVLAGLGLAAARHRYRAGLALWLVGPVALGFLFQLRYPFFSSRFILYSQPALLLLAAAGLTAVGQWVLADSRSGAIAMAGVAVVGALWVPALHALYTRPADPTEDWRPLAADLRSLIHADDLLIYDRAWMPGYLHSYLPPAPEPVYRLGFFDVNRLEAQLAPLVADYRRMWLVSYKVGLGSLAKGWLRARYPAALSRRYGNTHVALFVTAGGEDCDRTVRARFVNRMRVEGCAPETVDAGEVLYVPLTWVGEEAQSGAWVVFVHLLDESGRPVAQHDSEPVNGTRPAWSWTPGQAVRDDKALLTPPDLPPGDYVLRVGMYDRDTLERLLTESGEDGVVLGRVWVR